MHVKSEIRPPLLPRSGLEPEKYLRVPGVGSRRPQRGSLSERLQEIDTNQRRLIQTRWDQYAYQRRSVSTGVSRTGCRNRPSSRGPRACWEIQPTTTFLIFLFYRIINKDDDFTARVYSQLKEWREFPHQKSAGPGERGKVSLRYSLCYFYGLRSVMNVYEAC